MKSWVRAKLYEYFMCNSVWNNITHRKHTQLDLSQHKNIKEDVEKKIGESFGVLETFSINWQL